jgi:hypothetical protein
VVCAQHGWSQGCDELDLASSDPYEAGGVNLNLVLRQAPSDPVSGSSPLRASLCDLVPAGPPATGDDLSSGLSTSRAPA